MKKLFRNDLKRNEQEKETKIFMKSSLSNYNSKKRFTVHLRVFMLNFDSYQEFSLSK